MSLIEQNILWVLPVVPLALFVVHAMMMFVLTWLTVPARRTKRPLNAAELRAKLDGLNRPDRPWRLELASNRDFNVQWQVVDESWRQQFTYLLIDSHYTLRLLLDEGRREVRQQESIRSAYLFAAREGLTWRFHFFLSYFAGPMGGRWRGKAYGFTKLWPPTIGEVHRFDFDTGEVKQEVQKVARSAGWGVRPVIWWFEASRWSLLAGRVVLMPLNMLRPKLLWGVLYPASYIALMAYIVVAAGIRTAHDIGIILLVSAIWWGASGGIIALLAFAQQPRKRRKPRRVV